MSRSFGALVAISAAIVASGILMFWLSDVTFFIVAGKVMFWIGLAFLGILAYAYFKK